MPIDVTVAGSSGWWLDRLSKQLTNRTARLNTLSAYLDGNAPLPEGAEGLRAAYRAFQKKARTNFGELVVEAVQERMTVGGFRIAGGLDEEATRIWSQNEMGVSSSDVHGDMLGLADGYVMVGPPESKAWDWLPWVEKGVPVLTREDPAYTITAEHPLYPQRTIAALKMYADDVEGKDYAYVYLPGEVYVASRARSREDGVIDVNVANYEWESHTKLSIPVVPVVRFKNRRGMGEFETHTDILDRINDMILQRLVIVHMQAFRQRATKGELPSHDESGDPINYNEIFRPGPGALWLLPDGVDLWESSYTDITPILNAVKDDIAHLAAVTRTPMHMLIPDSANQSAEGASAAREGLMAKVDDRIKRATYGWNTVMGIALAFSGKSDVQIETEWNEAERRTLAERADAASKAVDLPLRTKLRRIWQFPADETERIMAERMDDLFAASLTGEGDGV